MVQPNLTDTDIEALCVQIDQQLQALSVQAPGGVQRGPGGPPPAGFPEPQRQAIETATGAPVAHFWTRFKGAARQDLCQPEGLLYQQWHKWGDLKNADVVRTFSGLLAGMGIGGQVLPGLIVATAVIVLHLGVRAICDEETTP